MTKSEIQALPNERLIAEWNAVRDIIKSGVHRYFNQKQRLTFFAVFVNVSDELRKRKIEL